jgi:hypothetical protein
VENSLLTFLWRGSPLHERSRGATISPLFVWASGPLQSDTIEKRRRWYVALFFVAGGGSYFLIYFLIGALSGRALEGAALSAAVYVVMLGMMYLILSRRRRKRLRELSEQGQVECYLRRPDAPEGDRFRKWNAGIATPTPGLLPFQPVRGRTSIARGKSFDIRIHATLGSRYTACGMPDHPYGSTPAMVRLRIVACLKPH